MKRTQFILMFFTVLCLAANSRAQNWSGVVDPSRAVDWSTAGVAGGIPSATWTQCGATIAAYGSSAAPAAPTVINTAISSCGKNQYVQLGAGTFYLSGGLLDNSHNNLEIRGMGADQTFLVFSATDPCQGIFADICFQSSDVNWKDGPSNGPVSWTAGYSKGTTTITLASVPNLVVGNPIILDQVDDSTDSGGIFVCQASPCSLQGNSGGGQMLNEDQVQIVTVTGCGGVTTIGSPCTGTNVSVTISPGLYMPNWSSSNAPQAWWATNPVLNVGVQNLSIDNTITAGIGTAFFNVLNGWVKGVRDIDSGRSHVQVQYAARVTVRDSYFFLTQNSIDQSYGFECYTASDNLVENNIFQAISGPLTVNGACSGTVFGYNFDINNYYTGSAGFINAMSNVHSAGTDSILYEGNNGPQIYGDVFHGTHNFVTMFRNYLLGNEPACWQTGTTYATSTFGPCNNVQEPIQLQSFSRFFNVVGNVLGQIGVQTSYQIGFPAIFDLGSGNGLADDPNVAITLMRWGNYDTVNAASRFVASEVPSSLTGAQAPYSNPVPSSQTLPASFYLSAKPVWWPSAKPWPAIGPDVSGGSIVGVAGHAYTIPAQDCFLKIMGGLPDGTGPVLSFNANKCYASSANQPPRPSNVHLSMN